MFFAALFITMSNNTPQPRVTVNLAKDPQPENKIVKASMVDKRAVDQALQRQLAEERQKQEYALEQQRRAEQLKQEALQAQQALELANAKRAQMEAAAKKAEQEKIQLDQQKALAKKELEKQQATIKAAKQAETLRAQQTADKLKKVEAQRTADKLKQAEAQRTAEKLKQAEAQRAQQAAIKAQQDLIAAQHQEFLLTEVEKYRIAFQSTIEENRILNSAFTGNISCKIRIKLMPDGSIQQVDIVEKSGNPAYDQMSAQAVYKSAPFPMPQDHELYSQLRDIVLSFRNGDQSVDPL
jgi:colicin import membrane protein